MHSESGRAEPPPHQGGRERWSVIAVVSTLVTIAPFFSAALRTDQALDLAVTGLCTTAAATIILRRSRLNRYQDVCAGSLAIAAINVASFEIADHKPETSSEQIMTTILAGVPVFAARKARPCAVAVLILAAAVSAGSRRLFGAGPSAPEWLGVLATLFIVAAPAAMVLVVRSSLERALAALRRVSETDPLTEALNRRGLVAHTADLVATAVRQNCDLGLLVLDFDHFKGINDRYGHTAGDAILARSAEAIRASLSPKALVARVGGDEFIVLWPIADQLELAWQADCIRRMIESQTPSTISAGALYCPIRSRRIAVPTDKDASADLLAQLAQQADQLLYRAKRAGRNCVRTGVARTAAPAAEVRPMNREALDCAPPAAPFGCSLPSDQESHSPLRITWRTPRSSSSTTKSA
ncbi:GGDEF domain-containing protein [Segniliparus rugosus]|uniref:Diguanylate cyclase (GGDEF) domain-containing protein n=1 Tax=Segniliparus rugosus (strain ATCC BAA-974 / DSM 45345 / CCUG 50838 / CIP 108380 / JCM 13579 / CDC 945) TaxID=679197 RepID=E5XNP3_SEGRC|nr:GGDEF domain-containing protein [Segniliparus rugosus]EFV14033.1 diguanylate cyclase (GGDEF) domain-containing protein [Segniliparus rugosus ATCC BAA-974]